MKKLVTTFLFTILMCTISYAQPLSGNYYIPQGANPQGFASLEAAVTSLNTNGATGTVNFILDADTLRENTFTFNASLSAVDNAVIKPAAGRNVCLIVGAGASQGNGVQMIGFNTGYITFDGSNNGSNSRNLIVTTEQVTPVVDVPFGLNLGTADAVVLKNLIIKNIVAGQTNFRYGAVINDKDSVQGFRVENCQIGTAERPVRRDGVAPWSTSAGLVPNQFSIVKNDIYCGTRGVATLWLYNSEIIGNTIYLLPTTAVNTNDYMHGLYITGASGSTIIRDNIINCLEKDNRPAGYLMGIAFAGNNVASTDSIMVINNLVNVGAADETRYIYGIGLRSAQTMGNIKIYHNTIVLNNNVSTLTSHGIGNHTNGTGPVKIDLKNNIVINNHSGSTASSVIGLIPATSVLSSNFNTLISNQNFVNFQGTAYATLAAWQAGSGQDLYSLSTPVIFAGPTDLHLGGSSIGDGNLASAYLSDVSNDIDGDARNTYWPYMGADEITASPLSLKLTVTALIEGFYANGGLQDTLQVHLAKPTSPYTKYAPAKGLSSTGGVDFYLPKTNNETSYYVAVTHRNAVETWSASPINTSSFPAAYNFTNAQSQAYGSNMVQISGKWCIFSGDVNQDGSVDLTDLIEVDNDNANFVTGYVPSDVDGNLSSDLSDMIIVDNNNAAFVGKVIP